MIWPAGTRIAATDPVTLSVRGGTRVINGYDVHGGGGHCPMERFSELIPQPCPESSGEVARFNPTSRVDVSPPFEE